MSAAAGAVGIAVGGRLRVRRGVSAQLLALGSQAAGAAQIWLLVREGVGPASDVYFLCFGGGQLVISVWVLGFVYPRQLAHRERSWGRTESLSPYVAAGAVVAAAVYAACVGYPWQLLSAIAAPLAVAAAAGAAAATYAAGLACAGRPLALAGVALPANLVACAAMSSVAVHPAATPIAMCVGLAFGNVILMCLLRRPAHTVLRASSVSDERCTPLPDERWLLLASVVGGVSPLLAQAVLATFPAGRLSAFSVVTRLGLAATTIGVNAVLPLVLSWRQVEHTLLWRVSWASILAAPAVALGVRMGLPDNPVAGLSAPVLTLLAGWAGLCPAATIATRLTIVSGRLRVFRATALVNAGLTVVFLAGAVRMHQLLYVALSYLVVEAGVLTVLMGTARRYGAAGAVTAATAAVVITALVPL